LKLISQHFFSLACFKIHRNLATRRTLEFIQDFISIWIDFFQNKITLQDCLLAMSVSLQWIPLIKLGAKNEDDNLKAESPGKFASAG